ncbi:heat shock factor-binding protein 1 [Adelges cooleyi]|uniref:heat shock factor-binding protein 1 n=1 Tax=Adelges cooleyi TaxID=133065 RepID=UPI00217FEF35|nr:heat shock factor-binding protein 1 [Adelges cooleyi]
MGDNNPPEVNTEPTEENTGENIDKKSLDEMNEHIQVVLQQMKDKFQSMSDQILSKIDDMGSRIEDLEKNISDLMNNAGLETPDK